MITITLDQLIGSGILVVIVNIAAWVFAWGRAIGKIGETINNVEEKVNSHVEHHPQPYVLPECNQTFTEIKTTLTELQTELRNAVRELRDIKKKVEA